MTFMPEVFGAVVSDLLGAISNPGASVIGATVSHALSRFTERRRDIARTILLDEIRSGNASPETSDIDDYIPTLYRYWRAAQEGAGRLNLRLLAAVFVGQVQEKTIVADDFLYYADLLASLRRDEIILLGTFLRHSLATDEVPNINIRAMHRTGEELVPSLFEDHIEYKASLAALLRTGLVSVSTTAGAIGGGNAMEYRITNRLRNLNNLVVIESVVARDKEWHDEGS